MIDGALRIIAIVTSLVIVAGFVLFAVDELGSASEGQQAQIVDPNATQERRREGTNSKAREAIDDANDFLLQPFAGVVNTDSVWAHRIVSALLGLLLYGLAVGFVANWFRARA